MKKIIVTGFMPFNGRSINPSQKILEALEAPVNTILIKKILPVEFRKAETELTQLVEKERPDILLSLGQAGNHPYISVERVAINLDCSRSGDGKSELPDQGGYVPVDELIVKNGPQAYFSMLPVWKMVEVVSEAGIPIRVSYSAGTYVCNHVMYTGCHLAAQFENMKSGFIHVPFLPEQLETTEKGRYSMSFKEMHKAVQMIVDYIAENVQRS